MDRALGTWVSSLIELSKLNWMFGGGQSWKPGSRLRVLFAGYNGSRNTGADVRVHEMLRQIEQVLGPGRVSFTVMTQNHELTKGYFGDARQVKLPDLFPPFLLREVPRYQITVACEGSMFKSKFADALTVMMVGSLGLASAHNKMSVAYGAEAGHMNEWVRRMCRRYCRESLVITRNEQSMEILRNLGIRTELGTDTAWTFVPSPAERGREILRSKGWDGETPVLALCPINPFWWPVKASIGKWIAKQFAGRYTDSQYRSIYFHRAGPEVDHDYQVYLRGIARATQRFQEEHQVMPVLVAMEQLDAQACDELSPMLNNAPVISSADYNMFDMVSVLRHASMLVSSRYHAIVTSMPGLVPSAGITMDERIRNLMQDRGQPDLVLAVDEPDLESRLLAVLKRLHRDSEEIKTGIGKCVVKNLKAMARMGVYFEQHVQKRYPEFEIRDGIHSWEDYLPPSGPEIRDLIERFGE